MKKILLLLLLAVTFSACDDENDSGWNNRPGTGSEEYQNWDVYTVTIKSGDWQLVGGVNGDNSFYKCIVDDDYLDKNIFDNGSVMVYLIQYDGDVQVQTPLPYVIHKAKGDNLWTETISYDYSVGAFVFYVTYSDFFTENRPDACQFKIVMHW